MRPHGCAYLDLDGLVVDVDLWEPADLAVEDALPAAEGDPGGKARSVSRATGRGRRPQREREREREREESRARRWDRFLMFLMT